MTKDVLISISGLQFAGGENSEPVEVITSGSYYKKNGRHYIRGGGGYGGYHQKYHQARG